MTTGRTTTARTRTTDPMGGIVHAAALAPAAVATCCLVADRGRRRTAELVVSAVMLLAMLDAVSGHPMVPVLLWSVLLVAAGIGLALAGSRASRPAGRPGAGAARPVPRPALAGALPASSAATTPSAHADHDRRATAHAALGCIVMAGALAVLMGGAGVVEGGHHGGSPFSLTALVAAMALAYAVASFAAATRGRWQLRAQHAGMGASALVMGVAAFF
ncbi:hypothetical protein VD659_10825 [Herbiconiux sp. 11R-BC]|uniref:hypothetical protein n=1 Tax=Herbiconiux sp. 11R-BC TaxID=3111637 RepID=UPI003BFEA90F